MELALSQAPVGYTPALELALLRRSLGDIADGCERCSRCHRSPLVGERVYEYAGGQIACELCRRRERREPDGVRIVHGPEFGHTLKIIDRRGAPDTR